MPTASDLLIKNPAGYIPPHAMMFGGLGSAPVAITPDTPLPVISALSPSLSLIERLNREGDPYSAVGRLSYTSFAAPTGAGTLAPQGTSVAVGRATFVQNLVMWSTTPISGRMQLGGSTWSTGVGTPHQQDICFACGPSYAASLPVNSFVRSSDKPNLTNYIQQWLDPAVTGTHWVGSGTTGFTLADAINFEAKKVILFLGDSLWNGTGPTSVQTCIPWLVNKYYCDAGIDCRYILKAYSGSTSGGHETLRQGGRCDFAQIDAIFYNLGINDAGQAYATTASMANVQALVGWKQRRYPNAKLVILGPTPVQPTYESALAALRTAEQAYVAGLADPTILFCDLGNSFDRTVNGNYATSDTTGQAVHPADAGLTQQWSGGYNGNSGLRAWLAANLPAI